MFFSNIRPFNVKPYGFVACAFENKSRCHSGAADTLLISLQTFLVLQHATSGTFTLGSTIIETKLSNYTYRVSLALILVLNYITIDPLWKGTYFVIVFCVHMNSLLLICISMTCILKSFITVAIVKK